MKLSENITYVLSQEQKDLGFDDDNTYTLNEVTENGAYFDWVFDGAKGGKEKMKVRAYFSNYELNSGHLVAA